MTPTNTLTALAETLVTTGKLTLADGTLLRLQRSPDNDTSINDHECYGIVAPVQRHPYRYGDAERPAGFDGLAHKIRDAWGQAWWWQPTPDLWGIGRAAWCADRAAIARQKAALRDLLSFGFEVLTVEVCRGADFYGRPIVVAADGIAGVECGSTDDDHVDIVTDILRNLGHEIDLAPEGAGHDR